MISTSPVLTEKEINSEHMIALDQPEYYPIIVARVRFQDDSPATIVRFKLTDLERRAIAEGADLIISQPHLSNFMPLGLQLAFPNEYPLEIK
jgi:hypothetical protein